MRDEVEKRTRGYTDPKSIVRPDGTEILHGADWKRRKRELWFRCGGQCEYEIRPGVRCRNDCHDPCHDPIPRAHGRDDRLSNLKGGCRDCHRKHDQQQREIHMRDLRAEQRQPQKCDNHPKVVWFDGTVCPACDAEKSFLALTDGA